MPDDSSGNFSLTPGYLATPGQTILASQHNPPLEDIASAMTGRLPRSGAAPMGGPVKTIVGSAGSPAIYPNGNPSVGIHFANGKINFVGSVAGLRFIGELIPFTGLTAPALTVLPYGQTLLRSAYPDLWTLAQSEIAAGNLFYNNGDGSTTFGIGDGRGFVLAGKDNMGGTAASRLTLAISGVDGTKLGWGAGSQSVALTTSQIPAHTHSGTTGAMNANASHSHPITVPASTAAQIQQGTSYLNGWFGTASGNTAPVNLDHGHPFTTDGGAGLAGAAHSNTQPTMVVNFLLYAGA